MLGVSTFYTYMYLRTSVCALGDTRCLLVFIYKISKFGFTVAVIARLIIIEAVSGMVQNLPFALVQLACSL